MAYAKREYRTFAEGISKYRHEYYALSRARCANDNVVDGGFYVQATVLGVDKDKGWDFTGVLSTQYISNRGIKRSDTRPPPLSSDCSVGSYIWARNPSLDIWYVDNVSF